jgi:hypothetical protein
MKNSCFIISLLFLIFVPNIRCQDVSNNKIEAEVSFQTFKPIIIKWLRGRKIVSEFQGDRDSRFQPYLIDINGDGKKELAIRNNCAMVGNCQLWLFKRTGKKYKIILQSIPAGVQTFRIKTTKTNNFFDIETKDHGDAWSGGIEVYKFNGKKYKVSDCYTYNYSYFLNGKIYELKQPKITHIKCSN